MLGSSGPGAANEANADTFAPTGNKGDLLSRNQRRVRPDGDACNARKGTLSPAMGATCGRREREAGTGNEEERSFHVPAAATVEGTLVHGMPIAFAGCRRSVGLGRSEASVWGSFPGSRSHRRQQVSSGRMRRGTSSACARRTHSSRSRRKSATHERGHVLRSVQRPVHVNRH